jgi:hypothetical protein
MKKVAVFLVVSVSGLALTACGAVADPTPAAQAASDVAVPEAGLTQTKDEAAVTVTVTPLNLDDPSAVTLDFEIALNTHSVELAYNMLSISALRSDTGQETQPVAWDGPTGGGHHVSGTLSFPSLKERSQSVTLILRGIAGVPARTFEWEMK